jgi:hypothetical protein
MSITLHIVANDDGFDCDRYAGTELSQHRCLNKDGSMPIGLRLDAAKAAVRYEKPALAAIEHSGSLQTKPAHLMTDDELAAIAAGGLSSSNQAPVDPKSSTDRSYRT